LSRCSRAGFRRFRLPSCREIFPTPQSTRSPDRSAQRSSAILRFEIRSCPSCLEAQEPCAAAPAVRYSESELGKRKMWDSASPGPSRWSSRPSVHRPAHHPVCGNRTFLCGNGGIGGALGWDSAIWSGRGAPASAALWGSVIGLFWSAARFFWRANTFSISSRLLHIAVLVEIYDGRSVPVGQSQIGYGATFVKAHFAESSVLFGVDQLIKAVCARCSARSTSSRPFCRSSHCKAYSSSESFVRMSLKYVDESSSPISSARRRSIPGARRATVSYFCAELHALPEERAWLSL